MQIAQQAEDRYCLQGSVDFTDVLQMRAEVDQLLATRPKLVLSLAGVENASSLLLVLMLGWIRRAEQLRHQVLFADLPASLQRLISFVGMDAVLPLEAGSTSA